MRSFRKPIVPDPNEVQRILQSLGADKILPADYPRAGDRIRVTEGPFNGFSGTVEEVFLLRQSLKASINIFGRETPVELQFNQVERL